MARKSAPAQVNDDMVMSIDICATVLDVAGVTPPVPLHGKSLFGEEVKERHYTFAARDKMDTTHDAMRSIRSKDYKLILNLMPERAYCQFSFYKEGAYPALAEMNVLNSEGKLTPEQAAFMSPTKPPVELFDLRSDPHEVHNVADNPEYADVKAELLAELERWRKEVILDQGVTDDFRAHGVFPEERPADQPVGQWVVDHADECDFLLNGVPSWYPTRSLDQWRQVRKLWEPWVFRDANSQMKRPVVPFTQKPKGRDR